MIWQVLTGLVGLGGEVAKARTDLKLRKIEAEAKIEEARAAAAAAVIQHDGAWELLAVSDAKTSWKDEYWTILLGVPVVSAFVPGAAPYIGAGFDVLGTTPEWYRWALMAAISFAFGRRIMPEIGKKKGGHNGQGK